MDTFATQTGDHHLPPRCHVMLASIFHRMDLLWSGAIRKPTSICCSSSRLSVSVQPPSPLIVLSSACRSNCICITSATWSAVKVDEARCFIYANVHFTFKILLLAFLGLMHLRIALTAAVLRRAWRCISVALTIISQRRRNPLLARWALT